MRATLTCFYFEMMSIHPSPPLFTWPLLPRRVTWLTEPSRCTHSFVRSCSNRRRRSSSRREVSSSSSAMVLKEDRGRSRTQPQLVDEQVQQLELRHVCTGSASGHAQRLSERAVAPQSHMTVSRLCLSYRCMCVHL